MTTRTLRVGADEVPARIIEGEMNNRKGTHIFPSGSARKNRRILRALAQGKAFQLDYNPDDPQRKLNPRLQLTTLGWAFQQACGQHGYAFALGEIGAALRVVIFRQNGLYPLWLGALPDDSSVATDTFLFVSQKGRKVGLVGWAMDWSEGRRVIILWPTSHWRSRRLSAIIYPFGELRFGVMRPLDPAEMLAANRQEAAATLTQVRANGLPQ